MTTISPERKYTSGSQFLYASWQIASVLLLLLAMSSVAAQAQLANISYTTASDGNGGLIITGFSATGTGPLVIPGTITGLTVTGIGNVSNAQGAHGAFFGNTNITSVTIPDSVASISDDAFESCTSLTTVNFGTGLTSIGIVNDPNQVGGAFFGCTSLSSVTIPNSVTSIGDGSFDDCTGLTSVTLGNGVTSIGTYVFYGCTSLSSVTFPDSVTSIGGEAYDGCTALASVTFGNSVTSIGQWAFYQCASLTRVTIPGSVTSIAADVFNGCTNLTSATFLGNAPTMQGGVFSAAANGFTVNYSGGATGFSSPIWDGYPAITAGSFNGTALGGVWYYSAWFGTYNTTYYPWINRTDLGFIYVSTSNNTDLYLYVLNGNSGSMGWVYTNPTVFPSLYCFSKSAWLYFNGGTSFYNYSSQLWESY